MDAGSLVTGIVPDRDPGSKLRKCQHVVPDFPGKDLDTSLDDCGSLTLIGMDILEIEQRPGEIPAGIPDGFPVSLTIDESLVHE